MPEVAKHLEEVLRCGWLLDPCRTGQLGLPVYVLGMARVDQERHSLAGEREGNLLARAVLQHRVENGQVRPVTGQPLQSTRAGHKRTGYCVPGLL